jgi:hypothetical protein
MSAVMIIYHGAFAHGYLLALATMAETDLTALG